MSGIEARWLGAKQLLKYAKFSADGRSCEQFRLPLIIPLHRYELLAMSKNEYLVAAIAFDKEVQDQIRTQALPE